jgi:[amino group carrier protein]-lysine/ornithine hydrolase
VIEPVELLVGLLRQYSPTGQETGAVQFLVDAMHNLGYTASVDPAGNAVGILGSGPRRLMLVGHIDTVSGEIDVQTNGDLLYGRGAVDAKGSLACFTAAAARLGSRPGWTITVIGAVGEEGSSPGAKYIREAYPPPACLVIGEPSGWNQVTLGYKGSLWLKYALQQPAAHSAGPTPSACDQAINFIEQLGAYASQYNNGKSRRFDQLTYSVREMTSSQDGFSDTAGLGINLRLPPGINLGSLPEELSELANPGALTLYEGLPAYRSEKNTPLVRAFLAAVRQAGGKPGFILKSGTSDMNVLAPAWDCPCLAYGPGDSNLDHTPQEHISLEEYLKGIEVMTSAISHLTALPEDQEQ